MEHKSISRMLLIAGAVVALFAAAVLFAAVPITIFTVLDISLFRKLLTLAVYVFIAYFAFAALIKYARICVMIGRNQSFSRENVVNMDKIAKYLFCCGGCFLLTIFTLWANITYWPEIIASLGCGGLGVIAYALSRLLDHAVSLQEENDLTV